MNLPSQLNRMGRKLLYTKEMQQRDSALLGGGDDENPILENPGDPNTQQTDWRALHDIISLVSAPQENAPQTAQPQPGAIAQPVNNALAIQSPPTTETQPPADVNLTNFRNSFFGTPAQEQSYNELFPAQNSAQLPMELTASPQDLSQQQSTWDSLEPVDQLPRASKEKNTDRIMSEIEEKQNSPAVRESSMPKRLGSGLWNAFKLWGEKGAPGGLPGLLGALATGGTAFAVSPDMQANFKKEQGLQKLWGEFGQSAKIEEWQAKQAKTEAETNWQNQRPIIENRKVDVSQAKAEADAKYKDEQIKLGTQKANELKIYRDAIIDLKERGADQNDEKIKLLEATLEERKRANREAEKDKDLDRDARIKVAEIINQGKIAVANIQQDGQNNRTMIDSADKARAVLASIEKQGLIEQSKNGWSNEETRKRIDEKKKAVLDGLSQEVKSSLNQ